MTTRLSFRCPAELVEAVDRVRGQMPRERWLRAVVESATDGPGVLVSNPPENDNQPPPEPRLAPGTRAEVIGPDLTPEEVDRGYYEHPASRSDQFRHITQKRA